jgi:hypothetical protein
MLGLRRRHDIMAKGPRNGTSHFLIAPVVPAMKILTTKLLAKLSAVERNDVNKKIESAAAFAADKLFLPRQNVTWKRLSGVLKSR